MEFDWCFAQISRIIKLCALKYAYKINLLASKGCSGDREGERDRENERERERVDS